MYITYYPLNKTPVAWNSLAISHSELRKFRVQNGSQFKIASDM